MLALHLPTQCAICHGWDHHRVCRACEQRFARPVTRCRRCALQLPDGVALCGACIKQPPPFDATVAALDYAHPWDQLISRFKFHDALDLAGPLAGQLARAWRASGLPHPGLLLPVPLSAQRLSERGYNQSWEIARVLARLLKTRTEAAWLLRVKHTPHQIAFPRGRRAFNVQAAFAVEPTKVAELRGRDVTVVDDVMTTGATAAEIARVLRQAGASCVNVWVVARTPAPND